MIKPEGSIYMGDNIKKTNKNGEAALIKEYGIIELIVYNFMIEDTTYIPENIKAYKDRYTFTFNTVTECGEEHICEEVTKTVYYEECMEKLLINLAGHEFMWSRADETFRWIPKPAIGRGTMINDWITFFENGELRIDAEYAEMNLSPDALWYAYDYKDGYYVWNYLDYSHIPVLFEIPKAFEEMKRDYDHRILSPEIKNIDKNFYYSGAYISKHFPDRDIMPEMYKLNYERVLFEPIKEETDNEIQSI